MIGGIMIGREVLGFGRRWELTAPESYALLHGPKREHGTQAFKLALIELIARKKISLVEEEKRGFFRRKGITLLLLARIAGTQRADHSPPC
jgi:hypothetical protein